VTLQRAISAQGGIVGNPDVHDHDVRLRQGNPKQGLAGSFRLADDREVRLGVQKLWYTTTNDLVVINDEGACDPARVHIRIPTDGVRIGHI